MFNRTFNSFWLLAVSLPTIALGYDGDGSGVSDVFESIHGAVLPASEDFDLDGYSNYAESLFGSDPFDATSPGSLDLLVSDGSGAIDVPAQEGLRYRVEYKESLSDVTWLSFGEVVVDDLEAQRFDFDLGGLGNRLFLRLELLEPLNSDTDGLNDWEEAQLGTDKLLSDTDDDLLDDDVEAMLAGSNPLLMDTDGDGFYDKDEYEHGSSPTNADDLPPEFLATAAHIIEVVNHGAPLNFTAESWSAPVEIVNQAASLDYMPEVWSNPIVVRNDALAIDYVSEVWSAPILVLNNAGGGAP